MDHKFNKFVTLIEKDMKENETYIHFLQCADNVENLLKLYDIISNTIQSNHGDISVYHLDINNLVSKNTIIEMRNIKISEYYGFGELCIGKLKLPKDLINTTESLDKYLYKGGIRNLFSKNVISD